jgi:Rrf2 family protein
VLVRTIAEAADVPRQSLSKILHGLRKSGFLKSTRGPGGGYELARPAAEMRLIEFIEAVDGPLNMNGRCVLGLDECDDDKHCALHDFWKVFRETYVTTISSMTLDDAVQVVEQKKNGRNS